MIVRASHSSALCRWARVSLLGLALLSTPAVAEEAGDPMAALSLSDMTEARAKAAVPEGAAPLIALRELRDHLSELDDSAATYESIANNPHADPFVRVLARRFLAELKWAMGKPEEAAALEQQDRPVQDFFVVGGFDNQGKTGCDVDFGPEKAVDLGATYPVRGSEVSWHRLPVKARDGLVDLSSAVRPASNSVSYAATVLTSARARRVTLALGTAGAYRLWLNGVPTDKGDRYNQARPDQRRLSVQLAAGPNLLLLKVCAQAAPAGFFLRFDEPAGAPGLSLPTVSTPDVLPSFPKGFKPDPRALPTLTQVLADKVKRSPENADLRGAYALVLAHTRAFDELERLAANEAARAAGPTAPNASSPPPGSPSEAQRRARRFLLAARLQEDDVNLRRAFLEAAVRTWPESAQARQRLAAHELAMDHPERALVLVTELVREYPGDAAAQLLLAKVHESLGELPRAAAEVEAAQASFPKAPQVVREAAAWARRENRLSVAVERWRRLLTLRADDVLARRSLASILADTARIDEAIALFDEALAIDPFDNGTRLAKAELAAANGRVRLAEAAFSEAKAVAPDDPEIYEREGRALLHLGEKARALEAYARSLALRPQNPALREAMRSLTGDTASFGGLHAFDISALAREADAYKNEDAVVLGETTYVRVQNSGLSSRFSQLGVKVFTQRGVDAWRNHSVTYSPDRQELRIIKARVIKPDGSVVEGVSESENPVNEPWSGMYYDARARNLAFSALTPGDVLELQYRLDDTARENLLSDYWGDVEYLRSFHPKLRYQYLVDMPKGRPLYWNASSLGNAATHTEQDLPADEGRTLHAWRAARIPRLIPEPAMPGYAEVGTPLHVSTYKTWEEVGRYYWGLVRDQLIPDDRLRETVHGLLKGVDPKDTDAVVRALYDFVVTHTRYVALEFGIHGYKPYRVDRILARRFGDCKDKASLLHAMLKVAGVDSKLVLLRMRHLGALSEEPASLAAFNHAVVYVPALKLYLDGTAEQHGSRELPVADRGADVLVIEPEGPSRFTLTPEATADDNQTHLSLELNLSSQGAADVSGKSLIQGANAPDYRRAYLSPAGRKAAFERGWAQAFPGSTAQEVVPSDLKALEKPVAITFRLKVPRYAEVFPQGLRFYPFGGARSYSQMLAPLTERHFPVVLSGANASHFRYRITPPAGLTLGTLPEDVREQTPFGTLEVSYRKEGRSLVAGAELRLTKTRIEPSEYAAFRAFLGQVDRAFSRKVEARRQEVTEKTKP